MFRFANTCVVRLSLNDHQMLDGHHGEAVATAMRMVVTVAESVGAEELIDIEGAHIDGCLFHGQAGLDFAEQLVAGGGQVGVPTTLNVSSLDLLHPDLYRGDADSARAAKALMDAYVALGCQPTWTCAPYHLVSRPAFGSQVAWGESNAIVFANSVLGARTERYGDFLDICCALTGRAPQFGLHTDDGRRARIHLELQTPDSWPDSDLFYSLLGHAVGRLVGTEVAAISGLDERADEDRLKAVGAAAASSGAVAMFHAVGVTPEAATLSEACQGIAVEETYVIDETAIREALAQLNRPKGDLTAISVGTPHASKAELLHLAELVQGLTTRLPFYVNTSRDMLTAVGPKVEAAIAAFGATVVTDTCTYITPIIGDLSGSIMTNSGKWAYYAPSNLGVGVVMGSLDDCVASAVAGRPVQTGFA